MKRLILTGIILGAASLALFGKVTGVFTVAASDQIMLKGYAEKVAKIETELAAAKADLCEKERLVANERTKLNTKIDGCDALNSLSLSGYTGPTWVVPSVYHLPAIDVEFSEDFQNIIVHGSRESSYGILHSGVSGTSPIIDSGGAVGTEIVNGINVNGTEKKK